MPVGDTSPFPIVTVPEDAGDSIEQLGTKYKFWFDGKRRLYKEGRPGTGENWAEKVACEICALLDLPHAQYDFARWGSREGVVTTTFVPEGGRLISGNELLSRIHENSESLARYERREHRVNTCLAICGGSPVELPDGYNASEAIVTGADVMAGYLMLDCLIGNQDRHDENWGLVWCPFGPRRLWLAPTYDHASSLGRNESDARRIFRLETRDRGASVAAYCAKARSAFFAHGDAKRAITTLEAFREAAVQRKRAARYWLERLAGLAQGDFESIFDRVPSTLITEPAARFALKMLEANQARLLADATGV